MKPEQFIREFGVEKAREVVESAPNGTTHIHSVTWQNYKQGDSNNYVWGRSGREGWYLSIYETLNGMMVLEDLKRLLESLDLVNCFDDLEQAKSWVSDMDEDFPYVFKGDTYDNRFYKHELVTAIADHESIYGGGDGHGDDEYAEDFVSGAWWGFQHQQAKVEELQKRVDAVKGPAQTLWEKSNEKHKQGKVWESKALGECADEILDVLEQALKGEGQ